MPQIRLEGSPALLDALDLQPLIAEIHDRIVTIAKAQLIDCKTLVMDARAERIGDGSLAMLHAEIRLLPGRDLATKQALGAAVTEVMEKAVLSHKNGLSLQVTAEIIEFPKETYSKRVIPA